MKEQLKITIVGTVHPYRGGLATFNERLARQLMLEGHHVEIETFTLQYPSFLFPGKTQYSSSSKPIDLIIHRTMNSVNPISWIQVGNKLRDQKPDIVIFAYWMSFMAPCMGTIARICKQNKHTSCIALIHNMIPHDPSLLDKIFPKYFVNHTDGFITLAKSVISDVNIFDKKNKPKLYNPHPIYDHYGALEEHYQALRRLRLPNDDTRYILFFGFIRRYKGLDLLIEAFADDRLKNRKLKLIVAGEFYENSEKYIQQIEKLGLTDKIILHSHYISEKEISPYFSIADIVVQPYRSATQSGVTQIAYHFCKPMLVSNVGGLAEIVPHKQCGYVVEPSPNAIAEALSDFYDNNRAEEMIKNISIEKERFSWDKLTQQLYNLVKTIRDIPQ